MGMTPRRHPGLNARFYVPGLRKLVVAGSARLGSRRHTPSGCGCASWHGCVYNGRHVTPHIQVVFGTRPGIMQDGRRKWAGSGRGGDGTVLVIPTGSNNGASSSPTRGMAAVADRLLHS